MWVVRISGWLGSLLGLHKSRKELSSKALMVAGGRNGHGALRRPSLMLDVPDDTDQLGRTPARHGWVIQGVGRWIRLRPE